MEGDGMVAVVRGLRDSSLCVTLMDRNGQYTFMPNTSSNQVHANDQTYGNIKIHTVSQTSGEEVRPKCDSSVQVVDGRYATVYKTAYCNVTPTFPPEFTSEFPPQKPEVCRGHGNFEVGGLGSGEMKFRPSKTSSYRGGLSWPDRGSVFTAHPAVEQCSFANSLRKYPFMTPEKSCEIVERLINYTQSRNSQKPRSPSRRCEAEIRIDESPTRERVRRGDNDRRFDKNYDVRYVSPRRGKNTSKSVNIETQAEISIQSRCVSTSPTDMPLVKNVAISSVPTTSISESSLFNLSKSIQTLKSAQTCFSSMDITGRKLKIGHRRSKSQEHIRINDLDDRIITVVQDLSSTNASESIRDEVLKKLKEVYDSEINKRFKLKFHRSVYDQLVANDDNEFPRETISNNKNSNAFDHEIDVFRAELQSHESKNITLDEIIKDWLKDIPITKSCLPKNTKKEHLIHIVATNIKSVFNNKTKLESGKVLRNEILNLIKDIPIDISNHNRKYYLNKLVTELLRKIKDSLIPVSNSKMVLKTYNYGKTFDVYDTVTKIGHQAKEDEVRKFIREQLLDFRNKFQLKICTESIEELESELYEIILNSFNYIRNGKDDRVKQEVLGVVFDLLNISDKLGIYFATNLISNLKEKYKDIPQLKTRSFVIFNDDKNIMVNKNNKDTKFNLKWYTDQVVLKINEWILEAIDLNPSNTETKIAIQNLAEDIVDRLKYLDFDSSKKSIENEIEHLKYQIFKSMNKLLDDNNLDIIEYAPLLMKKVKSIPVPNITTILGPSNDKAKQRSIAHVLSDHIMCNNKKFEPVHVVSYSEIRKCCHQKPCFDTKPCCSRKSNPNSQDIHECYCQSKKSERGRGTECHKCSIKKLPLEKVEYGYSIEMNNHTQTLQNNFSECIGDINDPEVSCTVKVDRNGPGRSDGAWKTLPSSDPDASAPGGSERTVRKTLASSGSGSSIPVGCPVPCITVASCGTSDCRGPIQISRVVSNSSPCSGGTDQNTMCCSPAANSINQGVVVPASSVAGGAMPYFVGTENMMPDTRMYGNPAVNNTIPGTMVQGNVNPGRSIFNKSAPGNMQFDSVDVAVPQFTGMAPGSPKSYHMSAEGSIQGDLVGMTMPQMRQYEGTLPSNMISGTTTPGRVMPCQMNAPGSMRGGSIAMTMPQLRGCEGAIPSGLASGHMTSGSRMPCHKNTIGPSPGITGNSNLLSGAPIANSTPLTMRLCGSHAGGTVTGGMTLGSAIPSTSNALNTETCTGRPRESCGFVQGPGSSDTKNRRYSVPFALHSPAGFQDATGKRLSCPPALGAPTKHTVDCRESCCNQPLGISNQGAVSGVQSALLMSERRRSILLPQSGRPRSCSKRVVLNAQPVISNISNDISHTVQDVNEDFDQFLKNWVQRVPIAESPEIAAKVRIGLYNGIWIEITKLKLDPEAVNSSVYYKEALDREIDELLDCLPQTIELKTIRSNLKQELLDKAADINQFISQAVLPRSYKEQLIENVTNNIPRDPNDANYAIPEDIINQIAEYFILYTQYTYTAKSHVYKNKLLKEIHELASKIYQSQGTDEKSTTDAIIHALEKVPVPNHEVINREADEILLNHEVDEWFSDLPLEPTQDCKESMARRKCSQVLAKKLHDIEQSNNNEQEMKQEIKHFLTKVPVRSDQSQNIDFMVDELLNRLKIRPKSNRRSSIESVQDYDEFGKNMHLCSSRIEESRQGSYMILDGQIVEPPIDAFQQPQAVIPESQIEWISLHESTNIPPEMQVHLNSSPNRPPMNHVSAPCPTSGGTQMEMKSLKESTNVPPEMLVPLTSCTNRPPMNLASAPCPTSCGTQNEWMSLNESTNVPPEMLVSQTSCTNRPPMNLASAPCPTSCGTQNELKSLNEGTNVPPETLVPYTSCTNRPPMNLASAPCPTSAPGPSDHRHLQSSCCQTVIPKPQGQSSCCQTCFPKPQGQSSGCQTVMPKPQGQSSCCQTSISGSQVHTSCQASILKSQAQSCCQTESAIPDSQQKCVSIKENRAPSQMTYLQGNMPPCPAYCTAPSPISASCQAPQSGNQAKAVSCYMDQSSRQQQTSTNTSGIKSTGIQISEPCETQHEVPVCTHDPCSTLRQNKSEQTQNKSDQIHGSQSRGTSPRYVDSNKRLEKSSTSKNDRSRSDRNENINSRICRDENNESSPIEDIPPCVKPHNNAFENELKPFEVCERPKGARRVPCRKKLDLEDSDSENERGPLRMCLCMEQPRRRPRLRSRPYIPCEDSDVEYVPLCPLKYRSFSPRFY